ncbi:antibiotic biosynthesis monooxygenase [Sphingomonas sp. CGMCC 1.13654]|uniref:Antibiotic biosynthesis monooxygenase n=1 Tax=Sphingomonas chungangi TaxID=2683589 RepID=A0A838L6K0_9SPHN|nr:antibiotic biosynthesis monooxygenase [Sphingomonas chungangi]MBA2933786.1 antibiotic biosynthesis monooxygenase [Sphingomonas chungangi]
MAFDQIVTLMVKPGEGAAFEAAFAALATKVGASEPDTLDYRLFRVEGEADAYRVVESYASRDALAQHMKNPETREHMAALGPFLAGAPATSILTLCASAR